MTNPENDEPAPRHLSYSRLSDYLTCAKAYQLKRTLGFSERSAMWFAGGRAVHSATEALDRYLVSANGR